MKSGTSGILNKLHEKLAATRSSPSPLSNLDVPKLRELKSHSFPPPFSPPTSTDQVASQVASNVASNNVQSTNGCCRSDQIVNSVGHAVGYNTTAQVGGQIINSSGESTASSSSTSVLAGNHYEDTFGLSAAAEAVETTDERRKRWLMYNHTHLENIG